MIHGLPYVIAGVIAAMILFIGGTLLGRRGRKREWTTALALFMGSTISVAIVAKEITRQTLDFGWTTQTVIRAISSSWAQALRIGAVIGVSFLVAHVVSIRLVRVPPTER